MLDPNIDYGKTPLPLSTTAPEIAEWRRARAPMDQHPLEMPTITFNAPGPSTAPPDTTAPTPTYNVQGTDDEAPLLMPTMNFDDRDSGPVNAPAAATAPTHQLVQNTPADGDQGGESPLGLPDWGW